MRIEDIFSIETLLEGVGTGLRPRYLYFWSHRPARPGQVDQACLSQWWMAKFQLGSIVYPSAEHFMMAEKARLFDDETTRQRILAAPSPSVAKKLGREVAHFDENAWAGERFSLVVRGNQAKFQQNPELAAYLRSTAPRVLVEASPYDRVWGIGLAEDDPKTKNPRFWRGSNLLGFALMQVRNQLLT